MPSKGDRAGVRSASTISTAAPRTAVSAQRGHRIGAISGKVAPICLILTSPSMATVEGIACATAFRWEGFA